MPGVLTQATRLVERWANHCILQSVAISARPRPSDGGSRGDAKGGHDERKSGEGLRRAMILIVLKRCALSPNPQAARLSTAYPIAARHADEAKIRKSPVAHRMRARFRATPRASSR
jgi:hypothetical protein